VPSRPPLRPARLVAVAVVAGLAFVAMTGAVNVAGDRLAWDPAGPLAVLSTSDPGIEPYAPRTRQEVCDPTAQAGVEDFRDLVLATYPDSRDGGITRACSIGGRSDHKEGRAWDWMLDARDPEDAAAAHEVLEWLLATDEAGADHAIARRLGITYVIWDGRIWSSSRPGSWRGYRGPHPHDDHVHFSFGHAGAAGDTSFFDDVWEPEVGAPYPREPDDPNAPDEPAPA
jgi:hypothetical protein